MYREKAMDSKTFGDIYIYGEIVFDSFQETDVSPKKFKDSISALTGAKEVRIHINSLGGSAAAGFGIISIIDSFKRDTGAKVAIYIDGIAAGIASAIAMAGDMVYMKKDALFMVRNPFILVLGEGDEETERQKGFLKTFEDALVSNYMRRFNGTEEELRKLMDDETYLNAEQAKNYSFIDDLLPEGIDNL